VLCSWAFGGWAFGGWAFGGWAFGGWAFGGWALDGLAIDGSAFGNAAPDSPGRGCSGVGPGLDIAGNRTVRALAVPAVGGLRRFVGVRSVQIQVRTGSSEVVRDLTAECERFLAEAGADDGLLSVWVPHATAGLAVIETGAGSDDDLLAALRDLLPADDRWRHRHGSPGHGRDHVLPALVSPSLCVPVLGGRMALGTWQSVCLVDTNGDNPSRHVRLSFLPG
jgi:secondary thiamine-phosphate synthase enzyme